jgi:hypothetical protein
MSTTDSVKLRYEKYLEQWEIQRITKLDVNTLSQHDTK